MSTPLEKYLKNLRKLDKFRTIVEAVRTGRTLHVGGVYGSSFAVLAAALEKEISGAVLVVVARPSRAEEALDDLSNFFPPEALTLFPYSGSHDAAEDRTARHLRLSLLSRFLFDAPPRVVVTPVEAVASPVWPRRALEKNCLLIHQGREINLTEIEAWLEARGMRKVPLAEAPGEWSRRGSVFDIFPFSALAPCRLELFGDTVESIREYNPRSQASVRTMRRCRVIAIRGDRSYRSPDGVVAASLLDFLPAQSAVLLLEPERLEARINEIFQKTADAKLPLLYGDFISRIGDGGRIFLSSLPRPQGEDGFDFSIHSVERFSDFAGSRSAFLDALDEKKKRPLSS
jgi:transcription-repair coupling factor (superfamily II helicase)